MVAQQNEGGILLHAGNDHGISEECRRFMDLAANLGIESFLQTTIERNERGARFRLREELLNSLVPGRDTLQLCERFQFDPLASEADLEREILLAMLSSPVTFEYPGCTEFAASVRIRRNIVKASRVTAISCSHARKIRCVWIPDFQRLLTGDAAQNFGLADKISIHPDWWQLK